ncbi:NUDIX hydrolase [Clostridium chromiireducens]|uniref:NUDIX domain-containing protein n=1 Tax=Clostridium chromiireducens TaxID=225345 RepID=A0A964RMX7_9CLOT|nr:NUDIX hydrolase [Clostridium chromiireducens]MVX64425.1 NUDIX domain-containing protein [Clostridium chromiireducens]
MSWIDMIKDYTPCDNQEKSDKEVIIKYSKILNDMLFRDNEIIHMTSSAFIVNKAKDKVLMIHHNIYNSWAWTGGHADGEEDLLLVASNEAREETGIKNIIPITKEIVSIDILPVFGHVKRGKYVSAHLHASVAFLFQADENEILTVKPDENSGVKWIPINEIDLYSSEPHMKVVYEKIVYKLKNQLFI